MASFYISPSVNVREVDLTTAIPAVATSIGAIVLRNTFKGPEMKPQYISSINQLIEVFGQPRKRTYDSEGNFTKVSECYEDLNSAMGYLLYGRNLYCTRVMPPSASFAGTKVESDGTFVDFDPPLTLRTETSDGDITDPDEFHDEVDTAIDSNGDGMWIIAQSRGYWGNSIRVAIIDLDTQTDILSGGAGSWDDNVEAAVQAIDSPLQSKDDMLVIVQDIPYQQGGRLYEIVEVHNVSLDEDSTDDMGRTNFIEYAINNNSNYIRVAVGEDYKNNNVPTEWITESFKHLNQGADHNDDVIDDAQIIEAYDLYRNPEEMDVNIFIDSDKSETVKRHLVRLCEAVRKDSIAITDVKYDQVVKNKGNEVGDMVDWRKGLSDDTNFNVNSSYVATYANWFNVYDKYLKEYVWVPTSGYMAGLYARTDNVRDPWWAPAGLNRAVVTGVRKLAFNPDPGQRDLLYKNNLNPIVSFSGEGKVVWGQKTMLAKSSAFNRVNVRRLFLTLEKAISTASKWYLFEQNDRFTRSQIKSAIVPYLEDVRSRRGIYDFYVVCDETNNTPERIDRNELWVDIYIAPVRSVEYIVLSFIATKTEASFKELAEG